MTPILEVQGVSKRFGGVAAVDHVELSVEKGSITAIIGPNGAGKTTLFNIVSGFERPDSGSMRFDDRPIERLEPWQVSRLGLIRSFQTPTGFPALSVWENLMVAGSEASEESLAGSMFRRESSRQPEVRERAESLLSALGLWEQRDVRLLDLSPGDVKLIDFGRLLMRRPQMVLLDEPASGVDPGSIGNLSALIKRLKDDGMTVLVIDHNLGFVLGIADRVVVMARGAKIADGTPDEIMQDDRVVQIYLGRKE